MACHVITLVSDSYNKLVMLVISNECLFSIADNLSS